MSRVRWDEKQLQKAQPTPEHPGETRVHYPELLEELPVGVVLLRLRDPSDPATFEIADLNSAAAKVVGSSIEKLRGLTLADFPKLLNTPFPRHCVEVLRSGKATNLGETAYGDQRVREGIYSAQLFPISKDCVGLAIDSVTERRQAEQALRESEERFRLLVDGVQEYAIFHLDPQGRVTSWNAGAQRLKGYRSEEIIGKNFSVFYSPQEVQNGKPEQTLKRAVEEGHSEEEGWRIRKNGSRFWASVAITALRDSEGKLQGFAKITRDLSEARETLETLKRTNEELERRVEQRTSVLVKVNEELRLEVAQHAHAETELKNSLEQLRALAARVQQVREEERILIAREIHDELGQACTALKMDLALIGQKTTKKQEHIRKKVASATSVVDEMIVTLRRIASELRPRALDDLGLAAAIEWQAQEFEKRTGINCAVNLAAEPLNLDSERSTAIFRIFQESLTNVARHARAARVEVSLEWQEDSLIFVVHDNGRGFDPNEIAARKSLGVAGMRERALLLNGELRLEAAPGAGTTLTLRIPCQRPRGPGKET